METRSQKRKREIEENLKRSVNTKESSKENFDKENIGVKKYNTKKSSKANIDKENTDIEKYNAPLMTKKLTISLDRINLICCQQGYCHEKSENGAEKSNNKRKREVFLNEHLINSQQVEEGLINAVNKPKSKQKVCPTSKVTEAKCLKKKKTTEKTCDSRKNRLKLEERMKFQEPVNHFFENEVVLATIPGYAPWPARILGINGETILVEFFGTGQINPVRSGALNRFDVKRAIPLLQRRGYTKAIRELELVLGIPHDVSII